MKELIIKFRYTQRVDMKQKFTYDYKNYRGFAWPEADISVLRAPKKGNTFLTSSLFRESNKTEGAYPAFYTLAEEEMDGLPSAYQIYMHSADEYEAAIKLVGSIKHWKRLCESAWFMDGRCTVNHTGLNSWREDMKLRDASLAKRTVMDQISKGNVSAAQTVINKLGIKNTVGRPIKEKDSSADKEKMDKIVSIAKNLNK